MQKTRKCVPGAEDWIDGSNSHHVTSQSHAILGNNAGTSISAALGATGHHIRGGVVRAPQDTPSESSEADSTNTSSGEDDEDGWESGESLHLTTREAKLEMHGDDI